MEDNTGTPIKGEQLPAPVPAKDEAKPIITRMDYNEEIGLAICEEIVTSSASMKTICNKLGLSVSVVLSWLSEKGKYYQREFAENYARAKEMQMDYLSEEILDIADDGSNDFMTIVKGDFEYTVENKEWVNRSKIRIDARKWLMSKLRPKKYGDKLDVEGKLQLDVKQITGMKVE